MKFHIILYSILLIKAIGWSQTVTNSRLLPTIIIENDVKIDSLSKILNYKNGSHISFYLRFQLSEHGDVIKFKIRGENTELANEINKYFKLNQKKIIKNQKLTYDEIYILPIFIHLNQ